ncbi:MAG: hypothetical protein ABIH89_09890 [Elusimicrobiota bacterium]
MHTSDDYSIIALGREDFVMPFALTGIKSSVLEDFDKAAGYISGCDLNRTLFIIEEELISGPADLEKTEAAGVNIVIMRSWGRSVMAERKIRNASIKALGIDLASEKTE